MSEPASSEETLPSGDPDRTLPAGSGATRPHSQHNTIPDAAAFSSGAVGSSIHPSVPPEDLSTDTLLSTVPRAEMNGKTLPSLGSIPLLAKLGQGGMGAVYYGIHPRLNKEVAVKVLPIQLAQQQPELIQRFIREAQIAASIQSPHLIGVSDVNHESGLFYLVMEFVAGKSAGKYLFDNKEKGLSEAVVLDICAAATEGLAAAHAQGVIHRDIKPDNILIPRIKTKVATQELHFAGAKLADLGLARGTELGPSLTMSEACMGTPGYMSPEQAADARHCEPAADVFSMGATIYALVSGHAPFTGTAMVQIILDTTQKPHVPLKRVRTDVTPATAEMVDCCLSKFPNKRFADASVLLNAINICRAALAQGEGAQQKAVQQLRTLARSKDAPAPAAGTPVQLQSRQDQFFGWQSKTVTGTATESTQAPAKSSAGVKIAIVAALLLIGAGVTYAVLTNSEKQKAASGDAATAASTGTGTSSSITILPAHPPGTDTATGTVVVPQIVELTLDLGGKVKMDFVRVPGGVLAIPSRQITFPDYYIGKYPVTVAQFRRFVTDQNYVTDAEKLGKGSQLVNRAWTEVAGASWKNPGFSQKDDHPVVLVTLADAEAFARWAAKHTKKDVILPNEVEWEYAARGAEPQFYPWGNTWDGFKSNHADISLKNTNNAPQELKCSNDNDMYPYTAPVGAYKNASWCGAYDMSGNVWQWCEHPRNELRRGWQHGGSWCTPPESCQTSSHRREDPDTRSSTVGFRVAIRPSP